MAFCDPDHSEDESSELLIGRSNQGRLLLVSYTLSLTGNMELRKDMIRIYLRPKGCDIRGKSVRARNMIWSD